MQLPTSGGSWLRVFSDRSPFGIATLTRGKSPLTIRPVLSSYGLGKNSHIDCYPLQILRPRSSKMSLAHVLLILLLNTPILPYNFLFVDQELIILTFKSPRRNSSISCHLHFLHSSPSKPLIQLLPSPPDHIDKSDP